MTSGKDVFSIMMWIVLSWAFAVWCGVWRGLDEPWYTISEVMNWALLLAIVGKLVWACWGFRQED